MRRDPTLEEERSWLEDALGACRLVRTFLEGRRRADLDTDLLLQSAVIRQVEVLGEACSRVGPATRAQHPEVPWRDIVGMRNRLIHGYAAVDLDVVWRTAAEEVPRLETLLAAVLGEPLP